MIGRDFDVSCEARRAFLAGFARGQLGATEKRAVTIGFAPVGAAKYLEVWFLKGKKLVSFDYHSLALNQIPAVIRTAFRRSRLVADLPGFPNWFARSTFHPRDHDFSRFSRLLFV